MWSLTCAGGPPIGRHYKPQPEEQKQHCCSTNQRQFLRLSNYPNHDEEVGTNSSGERSHRSKQCLTCKAVEVFGLLAALDDSVIRCRRHQQNYAHRSQTQADQVHIFKQIGKLLKPVHLECNKLKSQQCLRSRQHNPRLCQHKFDLIFEFLSQRIPRSLLAAEFVANFNHSSCCPSACYVDW